MDSLSDLEVQALQPDALHSQELPIVGIGASAGGLKALQLFFQHMPADSDMAFVVIVHLSPEHESNMAGLLQHSTAMPVTQVIEQTPVRSNHVYVIPPTKHLSIADGTLRLSEPDRLHGRHVAIDLFFRTLAETHGANAAAVLLSGTGSDGTSGLKRIKELGGVTLAQDPADAEYDGMPRSAIATGLVDYVLPAEQMGQQLLAYMRNAAKVRLPALDQPRPSADADALREIFALLRMRTGHDFTNYKRATMLRRIGRRLQVHGIAEIGDYVAILRERSGEVEALLRNLLISVTNFLRDHEAFEALEANLPRLFSGKSTGDRLRVWVAGCATGEEAFSVAMLLCEYATRLDDPPEIQIFATDIDEDAIATAREGLYTDTIVADVSSERLLRFFNQEQGFYRIKKEIRDLVLFAVHNLLSDPPFSRLDLITCRNLLIYLDRSVQDQIMKLFHFVLRPEGLLMLGASEFADGVPDLFGPIDKPHRLFVRQAVVRTTPVLPAMPLAPARLRLPDLGGNTTVLPPPFGDLHLRLLEQYGPPSVLVNQDYEIIHLSESAGQFLQFTGGEPSYNLLKVVHPDLRIQLRTALFRALQSGHGGETQPIVMRAGGVTRRVNLLVRLVQDPPASQALLLVLFDDAGVIADPGSAALPDDADEPLVGRLEQELQHTRSQLRTTIEQYETTIEELKASNEELQAINEELHSTTEELETSKEELQSINEELRAVNQELKNKIDEVSRVNSDLQNFLSATDIGTIFLDRTLRIMRYTMRAEDLFNLIASDINRPLAHVTHRLNYSDLAADAMQVLSRLAMIEREVQRDDGRWYMARLLPYRSVDDRIDGVVVTFIDITRRKQAEQAQLESRRQMELILESIADAYINVDSAWRCVYLNRAQELLFHSPRSEVIGQDIRKVYAQSDIAAYFDQLAQAMGERVVVGLDAYYPSLECWVEMRIIPNDDGGLTIYQRDISQAKRSEERWRVSEERLRLLNENVHDYVILMLDLAGRVIDWNAGAERIFGYTADEILGQDVSRIFTAEDRAQGVPARELATASEEGRADDERWHVRKDGSRLWISGVTVALRDEGGQLHGFAKIARDLTKRMQDEAALRRAHDDLEQRVRERTQDLETANSALHSEISERIQTEDARRDVVRRLVTAEEDERRRISRELHDQMGQQITALLLGLQTLKSASAERAEDIDTIAQLQRIVDGIGQEIHQLALDLRPTALDDLGLAAALSNYVADWGLRTKIRVDFHSGGLDVVRPSLVVETALYRVSLEALNNVARHAQAGHVSIVLERRDHDTIAIIEDDGCGFNSDAVMSTLHTQQRIGLLGMQERLAQVGGTLTIESEPGRGTTVIARIPHAARKEEQPDG